MEKISSSLRFCSTCMRNISRLNASCRMTGSVFSFSSHASTRERNIQACSSSPSLVQGNSVLQLLQVTSGFVGQFFTPPHSSYLLPARLYTTNQSEPPPTLPRPSKKKSFFGDKAPITWKSLLIAAGVGSVLAVLVHYAKEQKERERKKAHNRVLGKAKLGGDWALTDHNGNKKSSTDFRGQWLLIYFGFTHCPDVCPEEMEKIVEVINKTDLDEKMPKIQPILITVDPERDTAEALKEYCSEFSPRLLGFTGSVEEIQKATHAYRVYFSPGPKDDDNDYIVDHTIISYLVNPRGEFVDYFGQNKTANEIYSTIKMHIFAYIRQEQTANLAA